jgi:heme-degrading monooxygenase HmoA
VTVLTRSSDAKHARLGRRLSLAYEPLTLGSGDKPSRDSHLDKVPGFVEFHLLKGPKAEDYTLYASHTIWENRAVFEAWTKSEAFRAAHSRAGENKPLYLDHPQFEGFEVRQTVGRGKTAA